MSVSSSSLAKQEAGGLAMPGGNACSADGGKTSEEKIWSLACCDASFTDKIFKMYKDHPPRCPLCREEKPKLVRDLDLEREHARWHHSGNRLGR